MQLHSFGMRLCALSAAFALAACTFPGMKVDDGGSEVWEGDGKTYSKDNNHGRGAEIVPITPELVVRLAHQRKKANAPRAAAQLDAASYGDYRIGPGDVLSVIVWEHPELTNPTGQFSSLEGTGRVVRPDGTIFFPHVGVIKVDGLTVEEVRQRLSESLARVVQAPQVDVRVLEYRSQFVYVVGDVSTPCRLPVTDKTLTVIDALNTCTSVVPAPGRRILTLHREGQQQPIDIQRLYRGEDDSLKLPLRHNDKLYVEDGRWNRVFVTGEVNTQAVLDIPPGGMMLSEAISDPKVGGLNLETNAGGVYVIRGFPMERVEKSGARVASQPPQIYQLNAKSADALILADRFHLQPRDVIFASSASLVSYNRAVAQLLPTIQALISAAILFDRNN